LAAFRKEAVVGFRKGVRTMTYTVTIGVGILAILLLFTGTVNALEWWPFAIDKDIETAKEYVEVKCDPCDYNIDYGNTYYPAEKAGLDEGVVKLECDPCDYNIDHGNISPD